MKKLLFLIISILTLGYVSNAQWVQVGEDIDGEEGDRAGWSSSLNSDGSIVAIGAPINSDNGANAGQVRVYQNNAGIWTQVGQDINGEDEFDGSGTSVSLSSDGSIVAIGAPRNNGDAVTYAGHVRIYQNNAGIWTQVGQDINGEEAFDLSGTSVSLSSDGSIVAIGAPQDSNNGSNTGYVRVYQNISGLWTQLGGDIFGEFPDVKMGQSVSLSSDGHTMAAGALGNVGQVRIFQYDGVWTQVGENIEPEAIGEGAGWSVSLNSDGSILAIGAAYNDAIGPPILPESGHVRVYQNIGDVWTQVGEDIDGEAEGDHSGWSVSLSSDGNTVAIGAPDNGTNPIDAGQVRIFQNNNNVWTQVGEDIDGEDAFDELGISVSLSSDGSVVAIGAPDNEGNGVNAGHVRVYTQGVVGISEMDLPNISIHPNPTTGQIHIDLKTTNQNLTLNIYNSFGMLVHSDLLINVSSFEYLLPETNGLYLIQLVNENGEISTLRVVKQ